MQMCVERVAFAQRSDDCQPRWLHTGPHEQYQTFMTCFPVTNEDKILILKKMSPFLPESSHVQSECLKSWLVVDILHVEELDGNISVPVSSVHCAEPVHCHSIRDLNNISTKYRTFHCQSCLQSWVPPVECPILWWTFVCRWTRCFLCHPQHLS